MSDFSFRPLRREDAPSEDIEDDVPIAGVSMIGTSGEVLAYAGIMTWQGLHFAFFHREEGVHHPQMFFRLTKAGLNRCEEMGMSPILVLADTDYPTAERWLSTLKFRPLRDDERDEVTQVMEDCTQRKIWVRTWQP